MVKTEWTSISLPVPLMKQLDKYLETEDSLMKGYTSKAQVISQIIRKFLQQEKQVTFYLDSKKYKKKLPFKRVGKSVFCMLCRSQVCEHGMRLQRHRANIDFDLMEEGDIIAEIPNLD